MRNQFDFGLRNQKIQSRLLEKKTLTLDDVVNAATAYECAERGGVELHQCGGESEKDCVSKLHEKHKYKGAKKCFRCGVTSHMANQCSHKDTVCHFCKKKGHLQKVCFKANKQLNTIEEEELNTGTLLVDELFHVGDKGIGLNDKAKIFFHANDIELYSYCKTPLDCAGYIWVNVTTDTPSAPVKIYLIRSDRKPLLGREWLRKVKLDWIRIFTNHPQTPMQKDEINQIHGEEAHGYDLRGMVSKFPNLFEPFTAKIIGMQARLFLKPNATPRFFKARRLAFPLWHATERELERQVAEGLLVKVDQSEWGTPIVVVPKKDGAVRICGDYKVTVNPALTVDVHPLPTIEEHFLAHLDLKHAQGPFIEQLVGDIPDVSVFFDDIKITAGDDNTHIIRMEDVLAGLNNRNMRVNWSKTEFIKDSIKYCGLLQDNVPFRFDKDCEKAFDEIKKQMQSDTVLAFYDPKLNVILAVDASLIMPMPMRCHACPVRKLMYKHIEEVDILEVEAIQNLPVTVAETQPKNQIGQGSKVATRMS
ncbi:uncharacterized protein LOC129950912 [Eupeodes corollae]|uniref:uncharacterized protein LOC129950912 n=1 Tax=Eupeodes corollae TaxID=290404 RepID=UPI0024916F7A|nr:uncharacterized protein LOC129950912 [Eupeodes corollae]